MQALVLIAHGSRRQASNQEVINLANALKQPASDHYQLVEAGFLELAKPSIPEAIESCIQSGATSVIVVPYFLAAGRHVVEDIPNIVLPVAEQHPGVSIHVAEHIGLSRFMAQLILDSADSVSKEVIDPKLTQAG
jgi:sirohydrochlorin ferrochelatase